MKHLRFSWLFSLAVVSIIFAVIYLVGQSVLRMSANDPQTQLAVDTAWQSAIDQKQDGKLDLDYKLQYDIETSLTPIVIVYDKDKNVLTSSGNLDGKTPELPPGVLDNTTEFNKNILTWEPKEGVRMAAVVVSAGDGEFGWVLAARPLREVENRIGALTKFMVIAWLGTAAFITAGFALKNKFTR